MPVDKFDSRALAQAADIDLAVQNIRVLHEGRLLEYVQYVDPTDLDIALVTNPNVNGPRNWAPAEEPRIEHWGGGLSQSDEDNADAAAAAFAWGMEALDLSSCLKFDESTDEGASFNTIIAACPAGSKFVAPRGGVLETGVQIVFIIGGQTFENLRIRQKEDSVGSFQSTVQIEAHDLTFVNLEVNCNAGVTDDLSHPNQSTVRDGVRFEEIEAGEISAQNVRFFGLKIYDCARNGLRGKQCPQLYIEDLDIRDTIERAVFFNNPNLAESEATPPVGSYGSADITVVRGKIDRTKFNRDLLESASFKVEGGDHLTRVRIRDVEIRNPTNPDDGTCECMELRRCTGEVYSCESYGGSIGLSVAELSKRLSVYSYKAHGANRIGIEIGAATEECSLIHPFIDGKGVDGVNRTTSGISYDGDETDAEANSGTSIVGCSIINVTEVGITIFNNPSDEVLVLGGSIDMAGWGPLPGPHDNVGYAILCQGSTENENRRGGKNIRIHGLDIDMAGKGLHAILAENVVGLAGEVTIRNLPAGASALRCVADGSGFGCDKVDLKINIGENCPATNHISMNETDSGLNGSEIKLYGAGLRGNSADHKIEWLDFKNKLLRAWSAVTPEGALDAAIGSTCNVVGVGVLQKTTAYGTSTGWRRPQSMGDAFTHAAMTALTPSTNTARIVRCTDIGVGGSTWQCNGASWEPIGTIVLGANAAEGVSVTVDGAEQLLAQTAIPAGLMGTNRRIEIESVWSLSGSTNSKRLRHRFGSSSGGLTGSVYADTNVTTASTIAQVSRSMITNRNDGSKQIGGPLVLQGNGGSASAAVMTSTHNTAGNAMYVSFTGERAAGETLTLERWRVTLSAG